MIYLILCILSSTGIFLVFKFLDQKNLPSFPVILINYFLGSSLGFLINFERIEIISIVNNSWAPISILIGVLFIVMFFVIAKSSGEAGISITTVASKMSVVFPIAFSMVIDSTDKLTLLKAIAIFAALSGVLMTVYEPGTSVEKRRRMLVPLLLFIGMGVVDSLVKYAQHAHVDNADTALFSAVLFAMSLITGLIILPFRKQGLSEFRKSAVWEWGLLLGIVNFGSIFMMVSALNYVNKAGVSMDSSVVFGANNIGIVTLSVLAGLVIFREKPAFINKIGIAVSVIAIILFTLA
ncbi:MAG: hypothetical protein WD578_12360 [Bacteroidales bacterium]